MVRTAECKGTAHGERGIERERERERERGRKKDGE